jgi:hypothetical protein
VLFIMNPDLMRLLYVAMALALVLPGAISMARRSEVPFLWSLLAWGGLLLALTLGYEWWQDWNSDVAGPARLDEPGPPRYGPLRL